MKTAVLQILISLVIGFSFGVTYSRWQCIDCSPCSFKSGKMKNHFTNKLSSKLKLSKEQKTQVESIINTKHKRMMELKKEMEPRFDALRISTQSQIKSILTPEQKKRFDQVLAKWETRREKWRTKFEEKN